MPLKLDTTKFQVIVIPLPVGHRVVQHKVLGRLQAHQGMQLLRFHGSPDAGFKADGSAIKGDMLRYNPGVHGGTDQFGSKK